MSRRKNVVPPNSLTVKVTVIPKQVYLFGNDDDFKWYERLEVFCATRGCIPESMVVSSTPWVKGLIYCGEDQFQANLDVEGVGRKVANFVWRETPIAHVPAFRIVLKNALTRFGLRSIEEARRRFNP